MFDNLQSFTIPFLTTALVLTALEGIYAWKTGAGLYKRNDTLCNLAILLVNRLTQPLFAGYIYWTLKAVEQIQPYSLPQNVGTTILAVMLTDLAYYWEHRFSHKLRVLWFFHEIHHSSKNFNLSTSFRLHWLGRLTGPIIFAPLILLGFKAEQVVIFFVTNLFYQFLLHTRAVGKLGPLEGIINTPSAHRVHHARNKKYIDKNFGGILMLWDRMFGTYQAEDEEPRFGILGKFESSNPFTVQFHNVPGYSWLAAKAKQLTRAAVASLLFLSGIGAALYDGTEAARAEGLLKGGVEHETRIAVPPAESTDSTEAPKITAQISPAIGLWKGHVHEFHRHPTVRIESQEGTRVQGTYKGLLGKFPLTGDYNIADGTLKLYVDFSSCPLVRRKKKNKAIAVLDGSLKDNIITGVGSIPEFGDRTVHFDATKDLGAPASSRQDAGAPR
jgi:sterol desaturase/sphingolipid hydroxylase (fatty acid hydroxylase superfamily)